MDVELLKLILDAGIAFVAVLVLAYLVYYIVKSHRQEREQWSKNARQERRQWQEDSARHSEKVVKALHDLSRAINSNNIVR